MKHIRISLLLILSLFIWLALLPACKEKNEEYPPRIWSEYSYTNALIVSRDISAIFYENDHSLWLGAKGKEGLLYNDGYKWNTFDKQTTGIDFDSITAITRDKNNILWVGWKSGLATFDGDKWQSIGQFFGLRVTSIAVEGIGNIIVGIKGESGGIATFRSNGWIFETTTNSGIHSENINGLVSDHNQVLWLASEDKGIISRKNSEWENMSAGLPLISQNFSCITQAKDGSIWAGSSVSQLIHFYDDTYTILNTGTSKPITSIAITDNANIWCGTSGAGLIKFDGNQWTSYTLENEGLPSNEILSLSAGSPGILYFSSPGGKLYLVTQ